MKLELFQIDAFTNRVFSGNPAAVVPLNQWLPDEVLQQIAAENNLSETAFFVREKEAYTLRWFTPKAEVNLCGHATLASAYVLFEEMKLPSNEITFSTKSGILHVKKIHTSYELDFPVDTLEKVNSEKYVFAFGKAPLEAWKGKEDVLLLFEDENTILELEPNLSIIADLPCRGVIATAKGNEVDFVSRFFTPQFGIDEDPVTGSAHTTLTPFWANQLHKTEFSAKQVSKRGGELHCKLVDKRVLITGNAVRYLKGEIRLK